MKRLRDAFLREATAAVRHDECDVIILGCTGMYGMTDELQRGLESEGLPGVPVLDPVPVTVEFAAAMLRLKLGHSKHGFPLPPEKARPGYSQR